MSRAGRPVQVYLPDEVYEQIDQLCEKNQRSLTAEILHAIQRHLAAPPRRTVTVKETVPPLPDAEVQVQPTPAKRPRGRPRKAKGGEASSP